MEPPASEGPQDCAATRERQNPCQEKIARIFFVIRAQILSPRTFRPSPPGPRTVRRAREGWTRSARGAGENARLRLDPIVDLALQFPASAHPFPVPRSSCPSRRSRIYVGHIVRDWFLRDERRRSSWGSVLARACGRRHRASLARSTALAPSRCDVIGMRELTPFRRRRCPRIECSAPSSSCGARPRRRTPILCFFRRVVFDFPSLLTAKPNCRLEFIQPPAEPSAPGPLEFSPARATPP